MSNSETETETAKGIYFKLRGILKVLILICKIITLTFILCIIGTFTLSITLPPYSYFLIGLEISAALLICFTIVRMNSFRPMGRAKIPEHFKAADNEAKLLWSNISYDLNRYEQASSYYFNGVRTYKYSTIFLAGISTIVLGLDLGKSQNIDYAVLSKNIALVIGAIITVTTSLFTYWNIEKYWLINKTIVNKLTALKHDLEVTFAINELDTEALKEKIQNYKEIKETFYKYWDGALSERSSQNSRQN